MRRWFNQPSSTRQEEGEFTRWNVDLRDASGEIAFLEELGRRIIETYAAPLEYLRGGDAAIRADILEFTGRLFRSDGTPSDTFITFAGEVLSAWADEAFGGRQPGLAPTPHQNIPAFDAINVGEDDAGVYICLIQGKTTRDRVSHEANLAARQLGRLERGQFARELAAAVETVARNHADLGDRKALLKTLVDSSRRRYTILITHEAEAPEVLLTNYNQHVPGPVAKRTAGFVRFGDWDWAWGTSGAIAHAEAARRSS